MTADRNRALLDAVVISMDGWIDELRSLESCCPAKVVHLRAAMEQARLCLRAVLDQDSGREID
jgi:hypothetical protein